jgi:hypothetical protein
MTKTYRTLSYYRMMDDDELIDCAMTGTSNTEHWQDLAQALAERLEQKEDDHA